VEDGSLVMSVADVQNPKKWEKVSQEKLYMALYDRYVDPIGRDKEATRMVSKRLVLAAALTRAPKLRMAKVMRLVVDVLEKNALYAKGASGDQLRKWEDEVEATEQDPRYAAANKRAAKEDVPRQRAFGAQRTQKGSPGQPTSVGTCPPEVWNLMSKEARDAYVEARAKQKAKRK
jgi:hypothetical protein